MTHPSTKQLPQLNGKIFLSEAAIETELIFHHGIELPHFATFPLLESGNGLRTLTEYFQSVIDLKHLESISHAVHSRSPAGIA